MALSIENEETERLARLLANETGETLTQAIKQSLHERTERLRRQRRIRAKSDSIEEILRRVDAMPTLDSRSGNEIFGYDERGFPRR